MQTAAELFAALVLLVVASDAFTNAVEWIGALYGLTRSALGAIVAALGSSLPETMVAVVALVFLRDPASQAVGIGAVLGAPFMLATVVFALIGAIAWFRPGGGATLKVEPRPATIGLALFLLTFALIVGASFDPTPLVRGATALCIVGVYIAYLVYHFRRDEQECEETPPPLRFQPAARTPRLWIIFAQLAVALVATVAASHFFIDSVTAVSAELGIAPLVVSLFLSPIATELPEAMNVVIWMRRGMDDLAVGNVIGAMMFQTSIAAAIALVASPWRLDRSAYAACTATVVAVVIVLVPAIARRRIDARALMPCAALYAAYIAFASR